ncbi:hypothetical protein CON30_09970 [Bacillus cereus]|nr:hypothetical protein CON30_09970 [Bacillus cereus]PER28843.1 hypothetical protein CN490_14015 [Bacillus cereus]
MLFELHSLFFYYNFFVEILKLKRQGSIFFTLNTISLIFFGDWAFATLFGNEEMKTEKALPYFYLKKDLSPKGNNMSYPKFEIIFSVSKD